MSLTHPIIIAQLYFAMRTMGDLKKNKMSPPVSCTVHRIKPNLRYVNGNGKVMLDPLPAPDQHQK